jgi:hypothetical protein
MITTISLTAEDINHLHLTPAETVVQQWLSDGAIANQDQQIRFEINYPRDPADPRELSEIPEIRLWFVRLDARYPWIPYLLDWEGGELGRYTAMLVPHQFSPTEGVQFNPEALEIFVMNKVFVLLDWLSGLGIKSYTKIKFMTQILGYELDDEFFNLFAA